MPLYVADYLADTAHLSAAENGAYLLLIMHYWRTGALPVDDRMLQRISRMTPREWSASRDVLASFFDAGWKHKRIENELDKWRVKSAARADAGSRGGNAKALKSKEATVANASELPSKQPSETLPSSSDIRYQSSLRSQNDARKRAFDRFWSAWPHKVGKPVAERAFAKVAEEIESILAGVATYIRDKPPDRPWLNPSTFLNGRRWEDAPAPVEIAGPATQPRSRNAHLELLKELEHADRTRDAIPQFDLDLSAEPEGA